MLMLINSRRSKIGRKKPTKKLTSIVNPGNNPTEQTWHLREKLSFFVDLIKF
jgi:hypothetical protein